jgi:hypothetical protein
MDTNALISLNHIVSSLQNELNDYTPAQKKRLFTLAIEALTDLNIFYAPSFKTAYYTVSSINTVDVESDYIDYYRIGVIEEGKIWELTKNNNIPLINAIDCGLDTGDTNNQLADATLPDWHYSITGALNVGYYRYDPDNRRIVFSGDMVGRQVVMEYITSGVSLSGNTWVPRQAAEVLKDYIHWKSIKRTDAAMNLKEMARRDYYDSLGKYQRREWSFTMEEFLDVLRGSYKLTVKR